MTICLKDEGIGSGAKDIAFGNLFIVCEKREGGGALKGGNKREFYVKRESGIKINKSDFKKKVT